MNNQSQQNILLLWWEKSLDSLKDAQKSFEEKQFQAAMIQIYNAVYYSVSAALLEKQKTFEKHSGVRAEFHQEFVKTEKMDKKWGIFFDQIYLDHQEEEYLKQVSYEPEYVAEQLRLCEQFVDAVKDTMTVFNDGN